VSSRLSQWANAEVILLDNYWEALCSGAAPTAMRGSRDASTPSKAVKLLEKMGGGVKQSP